MCVRAELMFQRHSANVLCTDCTIFAHRRFNKAKVSALTSRQEMKILIAILFHEFRSVCEILEDIKDYKENCTFIGRVLVSRLCLIKFE